MGAPVLIESQTSTLFNALEGNVGSLDSPIFIQTPNSIFAGAGSGPPAIVTNGIPRRILFFFSGAGFNSSEFNLAAAIFPSPTTGTNI